MNKYLFTTIVVLFFSGCAQNQPEIGLEPRVNIKPPLLKISEPVLYVADIDMVNDVVKKEKLAIKEAPFEPSYFACGGVFPADQDTVELLKNAKTVFILKGSYEEWKPIEGKSKKYIVFKLQ